MTEPEFEVTGIGNALVDVISSVDHAFIDAHGFPHGATTMVDLDRVEEVYDDLPPAQELSGGSCANTIAGLASFGASVAFIGRVRDDQLGKVWIGGTDSTPYLFEGCAHVRGEGRHNVRIHHLPA